MSTSNPEGTTAKRETLIRIPLSALNRLRITCEKCHTVTELPLTKGLADLLNQRKCCFYCWDGRTHYPPQNYGPGFSQVCEIARILADLRDDLGATVEFVVTDPGKKEEE